MSLCNFFKELPPELNPATPIKKLAQTNRSFWQTKKSVLSGHINYFHSTSQLRDKGYLGPWIFNSFETLLVSFPAMILIKLDEFLFQSPNTGLGINNTDLMLKKFDLLPHQYANLTIFFFNEVSPYLSTTLIPLSLLFMARFQSIAILNKEDRTPEKKRAAIHAYLYLEGSYGFVPEMILVFSWTLSTSHVWNLTDFDIKEVLGILILICFVWNMLINVFRIPDLLIPVIGYSKEDNLGPSIRYIFYLLFITPVFIVITQVIIFFFSLIISLLLAGIKYIIL